MRIRCLGVFTISGNGVERVLRPCQRVKLLVILLLNAGHTVPTERLMVELWEDAVPESARNALHALIVRLRRDLAAWTGSAGPSIRTKFPGYQLELGAAGLDIQEFHALAEQSRELRRHNPRAALRTARRALALWQGSAFTGLELGAVGRSAAARLADSRFSLLLQTNQLMLDLGDHEQLVGELRELVMQHQFCERLYHQLMIALYRSGRIGDALQVNATARQLFARELGVDLSPEFSRLLGDILRHDPSVQVPRGRWHGSRRSGRGQGLHL
jgi:SARP family transcriptional regulator, regulator of embCAB operon